MYFLTRSGWPQFSTMVSIEPSDMPCQPTSSFTSGYSTLQPSSFSATLPITCALETYPVHGLTAMFSSPQSPAAVSFDSMLPPPHAARPRPTNVTRAMCE